MHIAIVVPSLHGGGAESVAREWTSELRHQGHPVTVYAYGRNQPEVQLPPGTAVHALSARGASLRPLLVPLWLRVRIHRDRPAVVVTLLPFSNVAALLALKVCLPMSVPLLVSEHNVPSLQVANVKRRDRLTVWLARRLYRRATGVLTVSHPVAGELVSAFRVPAKRIFVVPNPVVSSYDDANVAESPPPQHLHLIIVGRLVRQKRPELFLDVLRELTQRGISTTGTIVGDGPLAESLELEAARLGLDVSFIGWKEPWWDAVSDANCLVLTANVEGFGNVLVEAAAAGIPSVASSRALGVADAIIPGVTGELAMIDSPAAYADAVLKAVSLQLKSTVDLNRWLERFSTANSTATLLAALRAISESDQL